MNKNEIIRKYIDAWNQQDVMGILDLMHAGAAYYDAFWMETCVGRDLEKYLRDAMNEEPFWYQQVGDAIESDNCVVFRYSAHRRKDRTISDPIHFGAEILCFQDDKIVTITDLYCNTDRESLEEVAELVQGRHGLPAYANDGLGALKEARIKTNLSARIDEAHIFLDPDITVSELAQIIGCTLDQLSVVIQKHFGTTSEAFIDSQKIKYAKELLKTSPDNPDTLENVATSAGFRSAREFRQKFAEIVGVTPTNYCHQQKQKKHPESNSYSH